MKTVVNSTYGEICYEEGFWTGKRKISVGGVSLEKKNKRVYSADGITVEAKGNQFFGMKLSVNGESVQIVPAPKWYEYLFSVLILCIGLVWGNSVALCKIIPVVGGAIGGALCGLFAMINLYVSKMFKTPLMKILACLGIFLASFAICFLVALFIAGIIF